MLAKLRFVVMTAAAAAPVLEPIMTRPSYHYVGNAPPPNNRWTLFQPYKEFEVNGHLCRAHNAPTCTWFNAQIIDAMNNSIHNRSIGYYLHVPFLIKNDVVDKFMNHSESQCVQFCNKEQSCRAVAYARKYKICFVTEKYIIDLNQLRADVKIPRIMYYIKKKKRMNPNVVDHYLDKFNCRLNLFRCPS